MRTAMRSLALTFALTLGPGAASADVGVLDLFNMGCDVTGSHAHGCLVTSMKGPGVPGELARGSKTGEACGWNLLALISVGDVRIETAMKNGGISQVSSVDYEAFQLVPFFYGYGRFCTVVHGN